MASIDAVAEYLRTEWASHGVEVQATGIRSLTVVLPPQLLGMTELCFELWNTFGATTDFKHTGEGATITVWIPTTPEPHAIEGASIRWPTMAFLTVGLGLLVMMINDHALLAHVAAMWWTPEPERNT